GHVPSPVGRIHRSACAPTGKGGIRGRHGIRGIRGGYRCLRGRACRTVERYPKERKMMIHPDIYAALARERTTTFLARAETARLARQLRLAARERPDKGRPVRLRDGSAVLIRPGRPAGDGLLADGFARVRDRSRRVRVRGPAEG